MGPGLAFGCEIDPERYFAVCTLFDMLKELLEGLPSGLKSFTFCLIIILLNLIFEVRKWFNWFWPERGRVWVWRDRRYSSRLLVLKNKYIEHIISFYYSFKYMYTSYFDRFQWRKKMQSHSIFKSPYFLYFK